MRSVDTWAAELSLWSVVALWQWSQVRHQSPSLARCWVQPDHLRTPSDLLPPTPPG
jgi:hypothetical protein